MGYTSFTTSIRISFFISMLNQYKLTLLSPADRQKIFDKKGDRLVYIDSKNGFWNPDAKGYTDKKEQAWKLPLREAYERTNHCGEEKRVRFIFVATEEVPEPLNADGKSYTTVIGDVLESMYNDGIMEKINIDSKEGRYKLLERNIQQLRWVADTCRQVPLYAENAAKTATFIAENITPCADREEKIHRIWTHFLVKVGVAPAGIFITGATCFCIPILIDCWDNKI